MSTFDPENTKWDHADIPLLTEFMSADERKTYIEKGINFIKDKFKKVDFKKLGPVSFGKKPENKDELVCYGPQEGEDRIFKKDGSGLLKSFTDKFKNALGPSSEELLAEENQEVREQRKRLKKEEKKLKEAEKLAVQKEKLEDEAQYLRKRIEKTQ